MSIVSHGAQTAVGHEPGHGRIEEGEPVIADLYPEDPASGCYADMTRTFCLGEPPEELARYHARSQRRSTSSYEVIKPGVKGAEPIAPFASSSRTQASDPADKDARRGSRRGLLPLARPRCRAGRARAAQPRAHRRELVAGDVLAVEPGLYRKGFGGCRLEDTVLVTEDGIELLGTASRTTWRPRRYPPGASRSAPARRRAR